MSETKPQVFPSLSKEDTIKEANDLTAKKNEQLIESERLKLAGKNEGELKAIEQMRLNTEKQLQERLALKEQKAKELMDNAKKEGKELKKEDFDSSNKSNVGSVITTGNNNNNTIVPPVNNTPPLADLNNDNNPKRDAEIEKLSEQQWNTPYDKLPLTSEGKCYKNKKSAVDVSFITTLDESILTSPNLLASGDFLEVLINRKLLSTDLRYKDLLKGDRNAIMLWLRATAYGEIYPITVLDEEGIPFDVDVDLNQLKTIKLGAEPDANGHFDYTLKQINVPIKFKLLTIGESEEIDSKIEKEIKNGSLVDNSNLYELQTAIVGVLNGENQWITDRGQINEFVANLRPFISKDLKKYIDEIECGIDLELEVRTPRGGSIKTFLPLNKNFFWSDL